MIRSCWRAMAPGTALATLALFQPWLEQRMFTHMVVELPLLFAIGWWFASPAKGRESGWLQHVNVNGLTGLTAAMVISAVWMLPLALDAAVLNPVTGWLKVCSMLLAGWLGRHSLCRARSPGQAFFILNWAWMTGAAGALYQQTPERLCSTYLQGDQVWAGIGLVALAVAVVATWLVLSFREPLNPASAASFNN